MKTTTTMPITNEDNNNMPITNEDNNNNASNK